MSAISKQELIDDHYCFACGADNPHGLDVHWTIKGDKTWTEFVPPKKFQGWKDIVHGGILATLLDEAMTRLAWVARGGALTAEMTVRFVAPARVGEKIFVVGEITGERRRTVHMKASLFKEKVGGPLIAWSEGKAVKIR